jgi:hypothetical protein
VDRRDQIAVGSILKAGRHMGRDRYQEGRFVLVGNRVKLIFDTLRFKVVITY